VPRIVINGREIDVPPGTTVLDAAERLGIGIPALCHRQGVQPFTSCMVCVVRDRNMHRLLPSCTHPVQDGMDIETDSEEVRDARRATMNLLLSEHVGDCGAPCRRVCPARMNVPQLIRLVAEGRLGEAHRTAKTDLVLPGIIGRICPAPCEKGCRRAAHDSGLAIGLLHRYTADIDLSSPSPWTPGFAPLTGKRVAVIGAGPAGLAAAWHLRRLGISVSVFDAGTAAGGKLRAIPPERLSLEALDQELQALVMPDVEFHFGVRIATYDTLREMRAAHDAVVFAPGQLEAAELEALGLPRSERGMSADFQTLETPIEGIYAAGDVVNAARMAVRAVADGQLAARAIHRRFTGEGPPPRYKRFDSRIRRLEPSEIAVFMSEADPRGRVSPARGSEGGFSDDEARAEASRCMGCDCRKALSCKLRLYADEYGASAAVFASEERVAVSKLLDHPEVVFEPGKCIKCGLCVRICAQAGEPLGMTFLGRGYDMRVGPSFDDGVAKGLGKAAAACVEACPTAALAWKKWEERGDG
jgi:ferredoxin